MSDNPRHSDVTCPVCGALLRRPWPAGDWHSWDCYGCGLEVPGSIVVIDGARLIELARMQPDPRLFVETLLAACD